MRLNLVCLFAIAGSAVAAPEPEDVRRNPHRDMARQSDDLPTKYFHESTFHHQYDGRFADVALNETEQKRALKSLVQTYLTSFADMHVETWLMHGSLLGWWWNKQILPWDSDINVQVTEPSMYFLAAYYNMSIFHCHPTQLSQPRDYLLEVNPNYRNREQSDDKNIIDARWIDTETGLFIDITTARYNLTHPEGEGMLSSKDGHEYRDTYLFPLRETLFEGAPVKIPYKYRDILAAEYGPRALVNDAFNEHIFDKKKMEWVHRLKYQQPDGREDREDDEAHADYRDKDGENYGFHEDREI